MNFTIDRENLLYNLNNVSKALSNKIQMPGLTGILFNVSKEKIVLTASNTIIDIQVTIETGFNVIEEGTVLISGKLLLEIIKKLTAPKVDFVTFEDNAVKILSGKSVFTLNCFSIDSFISISFDDSDVNFTIDATNLKQIIRKTSFAISTNESGDVLTGVSIRTKGNIIEVTATDRYRLARKRLEFDYEFPEINIVVAGKSFEELNKIIEEGTEIIQVHCSSMKVLFKYRNLLFQSRLIEGIFPKIDSLIPSKHENVLEFNKEELISAIDRISLFVVNDTANTTPNIIKMVINSEGIVEFMANSNEIGAAKEEVTPISMKTKEAMQISYSYKYFLEALRSFDDENVFINVTSEVRPLTITSKKDINLVQLILPVRA